MQLALHGGVLGLHSPNTLPTLICWPTQQPSFYITLLHSLECNGHFPHHTAMQCQLHGSVLGLYSSNTLPTINLLSNAKPCGLLCIVIHSSYLHCTNGFLQHNTMRSWTQRTPASITSQIPLITLPCNANCMVVRLGFSCRATFTISILLDNIKFPSLFSEFALIYNKLQ